MTTARSNPKIVFAVKLRRCDDCGSVMNVSFWLSTAVGAFGCTGFHDPICCQTGLWEDVFLDHRVRERSRGGSRRARGGMLSVGGVGGPVEDRVATALCVLGPLEVVATASGFGWEAGSSAACSRRW